MSSGAPIIKVSALGKCFDRNNSSLRQLVHALVGTTPGDGFWALRGIDLEVQRGESVGIIGRNGSGKSTLLQILCGTMYPTRGSIRVAGRAGAMLELGAGFNPRFTGRENVQLSAAANGLDRATVLERLDAIEEFAEIGIYFDRPVQEYSSGMYARLAFAVCAHVDADILVIDEILSVGDRGFQRRCHRYLRKFVDRGGTLLFVSHDPAAVQSVCDHAVWLDAGEIVAVGRSDTVTKAYIDSLYGSSVDAAEIPEETEAPADSTDFRWGSQCSIAVSEFNGSSPRHGFGGCTIEDVWFSTEQSERTHTIFGGSTVTLHIRSVSERRIDSPIIGFILRNEAGQNLLGDNTYLVYKDAMLAVEPGSRFEGRLRFAIPYLPNGRYSLAPSVIEGTQHNHIHLDWREEALFLSVQESPVKTGLLGLAMQAIRVQAVHDQ